jgi:hypothetical protein
VSRSIDDEPGPMFMLGNLRRVWQYFFCFIAISSWRVLIDRLGSTHRRD